MCFTSVMAAGVGVGIPCAAVIITLVAIIIVQQRSVFKLISIQVYRYSLSSLIHTQIMSCTIGVVNVGKYSRYTFVAISFNYWSTWAYLGKFSRFKPHPE